MSKTDKTIELPSGEPVVITITRDFGAEGHEIGMMLSKELGIPLYDKELIIRAGERSSLSKADVKIYDEQLSAEAVAFLPDIFDRRSMSDRLFSGLESTILDLGSTQNCIIEGRLSDYILRKNPNLIKVLVTAPFDARVEIVRKKRDLNKKKGAKLVKQMQRSREEFCRRYSAGKWKMHDGKDLVVDRAKFGREGCVAIIAAAYRAKVASLDQE